MYIIRKEFHFSASHVLDCLPEGHPCGRVHGHNYIVTAELRAEKREDLTEAGFVDDYRSLEPMKKFIDDALDHRHLNDFLPFNPTAELMAEYFFNLFKERFPHLSAIEISETPKTTARYEPS